MYMAYSSFGTQWGSRFQNNPVLSDPTLQAIAQQHATTVPLVVLSWLMQEGVVAIPRSSKAERVRQNSFSAHKDPSTGEIQGFLTGPELASIRSLDGTL